MKNQNQNQSFLQYTNVRHNYIVLVSVFILAIAYAWWFSVNYAQSSWKIGNYLFSGSEQSLIINDGAAMTETEVETEKPARRIDGVYVNKDMTDYWPYAVMIENLYSVRPQSGLSQAAVVYETLAEGGSSRMLAVFDPSEIISEIMPVRSARPYFLEWVSEYSALFAHAGGSPKALTVIWENSDINDLEALSRDAVYFWRDTTKGAPHNLVTSSEKMNFALRDKELLDKTTDFQSWTFKDGALLEERGEDGKTASFNISYGTTYKVDFTYVREQNNYLRFNADEPHIDKNTGEQIAVTNVIVQLVEEPVLDGGKGRLDIFVGGEGVAWIFRDGQVIEGIWKKASRTDRTLFYDLDGNEVELNRGNTWIHVIPKTRDVTYN